MPPANVLGPVNVCAPPSRATLLDNRASPTVPLLSDVALRLVNPAPFPEKLLPAVLLNVNAPAYVPLSRAEKYKAKNLIDTVVYRVGDQVGAWTNTALLWLGLLFVLSVYYFPARQRVVK